MRIHIGDVVRHFKRETVTAEQFIFVQSFEFCKTYGNRRNICDL